MDAKSPARIALVVPNLQDGGLQRMVSDLAHSLDRRRFLPEVFCMRSLGIYAEPLRSSGIPVWDCAEPRIRIRGVPMRLVGRLAAFRPRVIHAHSGTWLPAAVAKGILRYPRLMFTDHGRYPPEPRGRAIIERWCYRRTQVSIGVSAAAAGYVQQFLGVPPLSVVPNGIDLAAYDVPDRESRARLRAEWGIEPDEVLAISVGRLVPVKDHSGLLRALRLAAPLAPKLRLAIVGTGELQESLIAQAAALGVTDRVRFLGFRSNIPACLHAADLFVMSSTTEGLPIALLEAMAARLPVLATRVGGIPEVLGSPPAGVLVAPSDPEELAEALGRLGGADAALRSRLGEKARQRAQDFSLTRCSARYQELYQHMLDSERSHA